MDDFMIVLLDLLFWLFILPDSKKPNWFGMLFVILVVSLVVFFMV